MQRKIPNKLSSHKKEMLELLLCLDINDCEVWRMKVCVRMRDESGGAWDEVISVGKLETAEFLRNPAESPF